ncbi:hypothetical protein F8M41_007962 [Gigaspora margarita]|uniref:Uncharacterized protein n=1 Tax=Gigaspora margarita TaxID=4874 RepID=A0A8H3X5N1_GIGMA|nr:hypothetical protein F8M41_007962 [Gigaspora margarita]
MSSTQSNDSLRELNAKLLAEICELRKKVAEIPELREKLLRFAEAEAENTKLKQIIEENALRDVENTELKSRVRELEARLAILEQGVTEVNEHRKPDYEVNDAVPEFTVSTLNSSLCEEDRNTDESLDVVHKKRVGDEIRQRKRDEKLQHETANLCPEIKLEQDDEIDVVDTSQIVEQGLIQELTQNQCEVSCQSSDDEIDK